MTTNDRSFYWRLSVRENLDFFAALHKLKGKTKKERIGELLALVGMEVQEHQRFMTLSTGQRQRLAIARALLAPDGVLRGVLNPGAVRTVLDRGLSRTEDSAAMSVFQATHQLWALMQLAAWMHRFHVTA